MSAIILRPMDNTTDIPQTLQRAFVLHTRAYRDTSLIVEFFTELQGRVTAVAKGARKNRGAWSGLLLPATPLWIRCQGKHELLTLVQAEPANPPYRLQGRALLSQFYLNELLMYLLHRFDPHPTLFMHYEQALIQMGQGASLEILLRLFELALVSACGYGICLDRDALTDEPVQPEKLYWVDCELGVVKCAQGTLASRHVFSGQALLALANHQLPDTPQLLVDAKRLTRQLIDHLLAGKEIHSRQLFQHFRSV